MRLEAFAAAIPAEAKKKKGYVSASPLSLHARLLSASCREALAAINRSVARGLERNLARLAAFRADGVEHFSLFATGVLSLRTAVLASLGFVLESLFRIELLLAGGEHELVAAFLAR